MSLGNDNAVHAIFPGANDTLTVEASTSYFFDAVIRITNGTTAHTDSFGFGGTATFTSVGYLSMVSKQAAGILQNTTTRGHITSGAMSVLNAAAVQAGVIAEFSGIIRINGAGTIIPQWQFSVDPTGTCQVEPNSFIRLVKIGSDTVASQGAWA